MVDDERGVVPPPLVTIIISTLNSERTFERALRSVSAQAYDKYELIVIDGGSTDGTADIADEYKHLIRHWRSEPDDGIYDAWNKGLALAAGEWICFIGADDYFEPMALHRMAEQVICRDFDFVSSRVRLYKGTERIRDIGHAWDWETFRKRMNIAHVGSFHSRRLFEQFGCFDKSYRVCGDYEFLLRAGQTLKAGFLNEVTVNVEAGGISTRGLAPFIEAHRAKVQTARRQPFASFLETGLLWCKWAVRRSLGS